ncbi:MAG TPA: PAS domain-containing sensor histidine kinase [Planctomycetota bacterium]|nr:PAS domain-containing sensor histidine kinase [Planctomycetota bacterium]
MSATDGIRPEDDRLSRAAGDLGRALKELRAFLPKASRLVTCGSAEALLEASDALLLEATDFLFCRIYLDASLVCAEDLPGPEESGMRLVRSACPEDILVDWDVVNWALSSREVILLPAHDGDSAGRSLVVVPLLGREARLGAVLLWVEFDERGFTEHASDLLGIYGRGFSAALEGLELSAQRARSQAFVQKVLESVPMGIFSLDAHGALTFINGTAEFMLAAARQEVIGQDLSAAFRPEVAGAVRRLVGRLERGEDPGEEELEFGGGAVGETHYVLGVSASRLVLPGAPGAAGYVFVVRDMEVAREVQRLREVDAMKDDLLSLVSHELRTPLASIMAYAEALLMEGMVDTEVERREYLGVIRSEGERLGRLINDVLDLTKMQAGKMEYRLEEHDLHEVLSHAVSVERALVEKKGLRVSLEPGAGIPRLRLDRDRVIQVVCNLLSNAVKFTDSGGSITVSTALKPAEKAAPAAVEVRVRDTGIGIPPEQVHKVWSRFEQVENVRHHTGGTGLGMPICRQIIEEGHGGRIWLESKVGQGTTVIFTLPV